MDVLTKTEMNKFFRKTARGPVRKGLLLLLTAALLLAAPTRPAQARLRCPDCSCITATWSILRTIVTTEHAETMAFFSDQMGTHQDWMDQTLFGEYILPALRMMTEQMSALMMNQTLAVGAFFDAKQQLETQLLFQKLTAQAHKDYRPSQGLCTFGTNVRSLAAAQSQGNLSAFVLSQRAQDRQMGNKNTNAAEGPATDRGGRFAEFRKLFCDPNDNNKTGRAGTGLSLFCTDTTQTGGNPNADIDFTRLIMLPGTLRENMADSGATQSTGHKAIIAMADNLYAHDILRRQLPAFIGIEANQELLLDQRAIVAKHSVAENTFNALVGLKTMGSAAGSADTAQYMAVILGQLGIPDAEIPHILGDMYGGQARPSYYAQMEILAKKLYQRPEFYTDLYDTPANVERKKVAMQAVGLMLDRDIYDSYLRSEALVSQILELRTIEAQKEVQDKMGGLESHTRN